MKIIDIDIYGHGTKFIPEKCWHLYENSYENENNVYGVIPELNKGNSSITIYQLMVENDCDSKKCCFVSFNGEQSKSSDKHFKNMVLRLAGKMFKELKIPPASAYISWSMAAKHKPKKDYNLSFKTFDIGFQNKKTLLVWFNQYGERCFDKEIIKTEYWLDWLDNYQGHVNYHDNFQIVNIFWVFPLEIKETYHLLDAMIKYFPQYVLVKRYYYNGNGNRSKYYWWIPEADLIKTKTVTTQRGRIYYFNCTNSSLHKYRVDYYLKKLIPIISLFYRNIRCVVPFEVLEYIFKLCDIQTILRFGSLLNNIHIKKLISMIGCMYTEQGLHFQENCDYDDIDYKSLTIPEPEKGLNLRYEETYLFCIDEEELLLLIEIEK